eukprot:767258-Hanusia_phi.AAC.4
MAIITSCDNTIASCSRSSKPCHMIDELFNGRVFCELLSMTCTCSHASVYILHWRQEEVHPSREFVAQHISSSTVDARPPRQLRSSQTYEGEKTRSLHENRGKHSRSPTRSRSDQPQHSPSTRMKVRPQEVDQLSRVPAVRLRRRRVQSNTADALTGGTGCARFCA